eukprot:TRINITY_DN14149_c0_g1_i3.p1 TRINITY_DN14149_c0_g1~~TRINITY_DN14149_c0_g1_i3.p1  ORF type:complete len:150 (-),score=48.94 TRINITY_DN14149_c0_g1_i3:131-580(-)
MKTYKNENRVKIKYNTAFLDNLKNKLREQASREEEMFNSSLTSANLFDILLGKVDPMQPMEITNESLSNKFITPESKAMDYDFRNIDGIYRKYPPALQLPKKHIAINAAKARAGKSDEEVLLAISQAGGYAAEYALEMFRKEALSSLEV